MPDTVGVLLKTFRQHPLRITGRFVWMCGLFVMVTLGYLVRVPFRRNESLRQAKARWLQCSSRQMLRVLNLTWQTTGQIPKRGLLVSNHLSYLDIPLIAAVTPATFVSKDEVKSWPVFGGFARMAGTIFVHRTRRHDTGRVTAEIKAALDEGALLVLFPEGTSSGGETVLPFKSALLEPAVQQSHILFAGCVTYSLEEGSVTDEVCYWRDMTLFPHLINLLGKRGIHAVVHFRQLGESTLNRKELARQLHMEVSKLKEVSAA